MTQKEKMFYDEIKNVFVGAKVEGQGGFVNLMKIKSKYYNKIEPYIKRDIYQLLKKYPSFEEELFTKLYNFFHMYFSENGSIHFNNTVFHNNVYEKLYDDNKDATYFWKTRGMYYVKTDINYKSMEISTSKFIFYFDASKLPNNKTNEKKEIVYEFNDVTADGKIIIDVQYSEKGKTTKFDDIVKKARQKGRKIEEEDIVDATKIFERQNEVDYFIHKNAKEFLQEQLKLWVFQYFFDGVSEWSPDRINQINGFKQIADKIIDFISQFEDELVKIWNKPKFVKNSNYIISLSKFKNISIVEKILNHPNFNSQVKEWKELALIDENFNVNDIFETDISGKYLSTKYSTLTIDTKYFKDIELEILGQFENLDQDIDGWLIKSENYQALNTILPKFKEKVQLIYIDPPYNTGSDGFLYKDKFKDSTWLTMMENRLSKSREFISKDGVIFTSIGDTFKSYFNVISSNKLINLMNEIFKEENFISTFVRKTAISPRNDAKFIANEHDYVLAYAKDIKNVKINKKNSTPNGLDEKDEYVNERGKYKLRKLDGASINNSNTLRYPIKSPDGTDIWPGGDPNAEDWMWRWSKEKVEWGIKNGFIVFKKGKNGKWNVYNKEYEFVDNEGKLRDRLNPYGTFILDFQNERGTTEIKNLFTKRSFEYPKPSGLIAHLLKIGSTNDSIVMDFFGGSGTTAHAVMKLNKEDGGKRKFILVEMGDYFYSVIIPRVKKVAYSFDWKDGKPQDADGIGIFVKYYELEQYEETLSKCVYDDNEPVEIPTKNIYSQYVFMQDKKMLDALNVDVNTNKVSVDLSKLYDNIDIAETISNLYGKWIKKITDNEVEFEDGTKVNTKDLNYRIILPLIWWK